MIEMFITLFVIAIVLAIGAPATARWVRQTDIRSSAESLRSALQKARGEAIARNARIRITLGNASGHARWLIGCVRVSAACPGKTLHQQAVLSRDRIRWGAAKASAAATLSTALTAGAALPGTVDFFPLGDAPGIAGGSDLARIDVVHANDSAAGRWVIRIDTAGNIRMCNPALPESDHRRCH